MRKLAEATWRGRRPPYDEWVGVGHAVLRNVDHLESYVDATCATLRRSLPNIFDYSNLE
jgi:hypothetical protein